MRNPYDFYITPEEYEIAENNGIPKATLEFRTRTLMWDKRRAMTEKPQNKICRKEWAEVAAKNGIKYHTFLSRILDSGFTPEEAATKPLQSEKEKEIARKTAHEKSRKYPKEAIELCKKNGIHRNTFYYRVNQMGMEPYEAATMPPMPKTEQGIARRKKMKEAGLKC